MRLTDHNHGHRLICLLLFKVQNLQNGTSVYEPETFSTEFVMSGLKVVIPELSKGRLLSKFVSSVGNFVAVDNLEQELRCNFHSSGLPLFR